MEVASRDDLVAQVVPVLLREVAAPRVERMAELRAAGEGFELVGLGPEPDSVPADREALGVGHVREPDLLARVAEQVLEHHRLGRALVREVDPIVEPVHRRVHGVLRVREREAGKHHALHVGAAVAVRVFQVEDVRCGGDEDAFLEAHDAVREHEPLGKDRALVRLAVAVRVFEESNASRRLRVEGVARHLHHEDAAPLVELHGHGRLDVGLGNEGLDAEPVFDPERLERLARSEGRLGRGPTAGQERAGRGRHQQRQAQEAHRFLAGGPTSGPRGETLVGRRHRWQARATKRPAPACASLLAGEPRSTRRRPWRPCARPPRRPRPAGHARRSWPSWWPPLSCLARS